MDADGIPQAGETITYAFTVTNTGNVTLIVVTVSDPKVTVSGVPITVAPGASDNSTFTAVYTLLQSDIDAGSFTNIATVTGTPPSGPNVTDTDDDTQPLSAVASIDLVKTGTPQFGGDGIPQAGETITYAFIVTNTGNVTLSNVTVTDPKVTVSGSPIPSLAPGAANNSTFTAVYTLLQSDIDAGSFTNIATTTGTKPLGGTVSDTDDDTQPLNATASINLIKTGTLHHDIVPPTGIANAGDQITYTFTVTNTGNVTLTNVIVTDPKVTVSGGPITLAPGASNNSTFTAVYTLLQSDINAGTFTNIATATGTQPLDGTVTDTDDDTQTLDANSSIDLVKTGTLHNDVVAPNDASNAGDQITYVFSVTNTGNVTLTNVTITDPKVTVTGGPIASLAPGAVDNTTCTATYTLTQADIDAYTFVNIATVIGTKPLGGTETDTDDDTQPLNPIEAIELIKTGTYVDFNNDGIQNPGDKITYTFTVTNTGTVTLTNIFITDPQVTVSGGPILSMMEPGDSDNSTFTGSYTLTQADIDAGHFTNIATVTGSVPDDGTATDTDDDTQNFSQDGSIVLVKTGTPNFGSDGIPQAGETISYAFIVTNTGNVTLSNVTVTDPKVLVSGDPIPSLAPGASNNSTFTAVYTLLQSDIDAGTFINIATATGTEPFGDLVIDTDDDTQPLTAVASIDLVKTGTPHFGADGIPQAGETITYAFTVTNTGNVTLIVVTVSDPQVTVSGVPITVAPGASDNSTFTAVYTLLQSDIDAGSFTNIATVTGTPPSGPNVTDTDDDTQPLTAASSIDLVKTGIPQFGGDGIPQAGETITYAFTVTNTGNVTLSNVTVTDPIVTVSGGPIPSLAPGAVNNSTFTAVYTLLQSDINAGTFTNIATTNGTMPLGGTVSDTDDDTQPLNAVASINLVKTGTLNMAVMPPNGTPNAGDIITYTFTVTNTGNVTLSNVTVTDPKVTVSGGPIPSLAPGASNSSNYSAVYTLLQSDIDAGTFTNIATATGTPPSGPNVTDTDDDTQPLNESASIDLVKTGTPHFGTDGIPQAGETITYVFTVTNTGNVTLSNVTVTDPKVTVSGGPIPSLMPGMSDNTIFTAVYTLMQSDIDAGTFTNIATATGTKPLGGTVTDTDDDTQNLSQDGSIVLVKTGTPHFGADGIPQAGETITYAFIVTNTGNVTLTNVTIADPKVTVSGGPLATMARGTVDNSTFTAVYILTQADINGGTFTNIATATGYEPLGEVVIDTDDDTQPLNAAPSIDLVKTGTYVDFNSDGVQNEGDKITYTFSVSNTGNVTLINVIVNDPILTLSGGPIILAPGASDNLTFTGIYTLTQADIYDGTFTNTATATGTPPIGLDVTDNDSDTQYFLVFTSCPVSPINLFCNPVFPADEDAIAECR